MGEFLIKLVDRESKTVLSRLAVKNVLAAEGAEDMLHQLFPPYAAAPSFACGVAGVTDSDRPNAGGGKVFDENLTFLDCTDAGANEGGGYTAEMRTSFGYARATPVFTASPAAAGGQFVSQEMEFPNNHSWTPQDGDDWDDPNTPDDFEQPPPKWNDKAPDDPEVGYPWNWPRKRCDETGAPIKMRSYMWTWQSDGTLDWLCDFRKMGGFPITLAFVSSGAKLVAAATFASNPILLRPGATLYITYKARIDGEITADAALRFAKYAFQKTGARYDSIWCRPALATAPGCRNVSKYSEFVPHFHADFAAIQLDTWAYAAGPPYSVVSTNNALEWANGTGGQVGPFARMVVYGLASGVEELIWAPALSEVENVPDGDTLRVASGVNLKIKNI